MTERVPGFVLESGDGGRGLSGTEGNVLIDGRRPVARGVSITDLLRRIPANEVAYLELLTAPPPGVSLENHEVLLNVVRKPSSGAWLAATVAATFADHHGQPQLTLDFGWSRGRSSADGSASFYRSPGFATRTRHREFDGASRIIYDAQLKNRYRNYGGTASSRAETRASDAVRLAVNGSYSLTDTHSTTLSVERDPTIPSPGWKDVYDSRNEFAEFGAELEVAFAPDTSARLNLLRTTGNDRSREDYSDLFYSAVSMSRSRYDENIVRFTATHRPSPTIELEARAEGAFNDVHQFFALTLNDGEVAVPGDEIDVGEDRGEFHAGLRWKPHATLTLDAALRWEISRLKVVEPGFERLRNFSFVKPRAVLSYTPEPPMKLHLRVEREVRQLKFSDFVASAHLDTLVIDAGNPLLSPETSWLFEFGGERRLGGKGAFNLAVRYARISDAVDYLPLPGGFEAIGNIGSGHRWTLLSELTLPLDGAGVREGLIRFDLTRRWSNVTDPVTGLGRPISREKPWEGAVHFSQDLPRLRTSWGLDYTVASLSRSFRRAEKLSVRKAGAIGVWAEHKPWDKWVLRAEAHVADRKAVTRRTVFAGSRANSGVLRIEVDRTLPAVAFTVSARVAL